MRFIIEDSKKSGFVRALDRARFLAPRPPKGKGRFRPELSNMLVDASREGLVKISATDGQTTVVSMFTADVEEPGRAIADVGKFSTFVFSLPGRFVVHSTKVNLIATSLNKSKVQCRLWREGYPEPELVMAGANRVVMDGKRLNTMLGIYNVAATDLTSNLSGVYLDGGGGRFTTMAMNSFGGGITQVLDKENSEIKFLLPGKAARVLNKWISPEDTVSIYVTNRAVTFYTDRFSLTSVAVQGIETFPAQLFTDLSEKEDDSTVVFDADKMIAAVRACSDMIYSDGDDKPVNDAVRRIYLDIHENGAMVSTSEANQTGYVAYNIPILSLSGPVFSFILDAKFSRNIILSLSRLADANLGLDKGGVIRKIIVGKFGDYITFSNPYDNEKYIMAGVKEVRPRQIPDQITEDLINV